MLLLVCFLFILFFEKGNPMLVFYFLLNFNVFNINAKTGVVSSIKVSMAQASILMITSYY
jgi:hypothetical protein